MKKLLALLIALVLPVGGMAEAIQLKFSLRADEASLPRVIRNAAQYVAGADTSLLEQYASVLNVSLRDITISTVYQEDAVAIDAVVNGVKLLDIKTFTSDNEIQLTSSFFPGYVLVDANEAEQISPPDMEDELLEAIRSWTEGLERAEMRGVFAGDAYEGGTKCTAWTLSDSDIAALMTAMMLPELREVIKDCEGQEEFLVKFDDANQRVAKENRFAYLLRRVTNDQDELVGLSATVFEHEKQLATVSAGFQDNEIRLVVGLGLKDQNYWSEVILTKSQREKTTYVKGEVREWTAEKNQSFAYAAQANAPAASYSLNCIVTDYGSRMLWDAHVYTGLKAEVEKEVMAINGKFNQKDASVEADFHFKENAKEYLVLSVSKSAAAPIDQPAADAVRYNVQNPAHADMYEEIARSFVLSLTSRLLQIFPLDVFLPLKESILP